MQIQRALEQLGYPRNEIKVYLVLLQLGEGTVSDLSRAADLPRSTTQLVVEELQKKGLFTHCIKPQGSVWIAESPSRFLTSLHQKEALLQKLLPELQAIKHKKKPKPLFKYFTGRPSIKHIFEEVINSKYPIQMIGSVPHMSQNLDDTMVEDFFHALFNRTSITQLLSIDSDFVRVLKETIQGTQHHIRSCGDERLHRVVYILFDTKVAIILLSPKESVGFIFEDGGLKEFLTLVFDRLWDEAAS